MISELTLDTETKKPTQEALASERLTLAPDGRATTEKGRRASIEKKLKEKEGLLNLCEVGCIGMILDSIHINLNTFPLTTHEKLFLLQRPTYPIFPICVESEKELFQVFHSFISAVTGPDTQIIVHNKKFDLGRIRQRTSFYRIPGSPLFYSRNRHMIYDTMERWGWSHAHLGEEQKFVSLERICGSLHIPFKKSMKSENVPEAIEQGKFVEVIEYNQEDCRATLEAKHVIELSCGPDKSED